jgi:PhnB protein
MKVQPYLNFNGRGEEAIEFYRSAAGAQVEMVMRFKESPDPSMNPPGLEEKIMHASLRIGESTIMLSDGRCDGGPADTPKFEGISLSLLVKDKVEAERVFNALSAGGLVQMPLTETFFSPSFGMLADKFGVTWMVLVEHQG